MARTKKPGSRKAAARRPSAKRAAPKKAAKKAGRPPARKAAAKKGPARKTGTKAAKKATAKKVTARKSGATKKTAKKAGTKRSPNAAFMKAMAPDQELAAVVGSQPQPRTEITKRIWAYIKKNSLQDPVNRRMINADDKLRKVFGGKSKVSMFEMTKHVNNHLT
jgi:upstream activation factor subunit UAF30